MAKREKKVAPTVNTPEVREALAAVQEFILGVRDNLDEVAAIPGRRDDVRFMTQVVSNSKLVVGWARSLLGGDFDRRRRIGRVYYHARDAWNGREPIDEASLPYAYRAPEPLGLIKEAISQKSREDWLEVLKAAVLMVEGSGPSSGESLEAMVLSEPKFKQIERRVLGVDDFDADDE